jgi:hypothetical protein
MAHYIKEESVVWYLWISSATIDISVSGHARDWA